MTSQRKMLKGARLAPCGFWPLTLLFKIEPIKLGPAHKEGSSYMSCLEYPRPYNLLESM